jgi:aspartyl/glutamyl-tRNA(Asn/Gln) amidotransferase C subunit
MKIDLDTIKATAKLAHIGFDEAGLKELLKEFQSILDYADKLNSYGKKADHPGKQTLKTPLRKDRALECLKNGEALSNHPTAKNGFFTVPKFKDK